MIRKLITGITLSSLLFTGCDLERLPLNGPSGATFPAGREEAAMGLLAAYKGLTLLDASSTHYLHVLDNITDIGYARPSNNYTSAITSALTTDNAMANKPWTVYYKVIGRCHTVLDRLEQLQPSIPEETYRQIDAELRVLRAYCYSQLIQFYGDVPLVLQSLDLTNSKLARTPQQKIEQFILDEITATADYLPVSQPASGHVRLGRVAAYMLKARVALYGKQYGPAAEAAGKAMELAEGVYSLTPFDHTKAYCNRNHEAGEPECTGIFGYNGYATSKEWIWVMEYNQLVAENSHKQPYYLGSRLGKGCCMFGPTQNLIDAFQCTDGLPVDRSPLYDAAKPFENRDPRLDMYCARPHSRLMQIQFEPNASFKKVNNYWKVVNGESVKPASVTNTDATNAYRSFSGYLWRKHTDKADYPMISTSAVYDLNVGLFRYAELLLLYAEAKIEGGDIDGSVYDAIDAVRLRAGMPALPRGLDQAALRTALRYERKIELCNDGFRWYDLRRWGITSEVMNGRIYLNRAGNSWTKDVLIRIDENASPVYNESIALKYFTSQEVVYKENKDERWPIPQSEINDNPALEPNPGY